MEGQDCGGDAPEPRGVRREADRLPCCGIRRSQEQPPEHAVHDAAHANDLVVYSGTNDWGVEVVYVCRADRVNTTLAELLDERNGEPHAAELSLTAEQKSRCVGEYAKSGFDCYFFATPRDPSTKVSVLESALLLGYPFDLAHGSRATVQTSSVAAAGASAAATGYTGMLPLG